MAATSALILTAPPSYGNATISILVGSPGESGADTFQTFVMHEGLVRVQSPFFESAMAHDWKEAREKVVRLPDDEPDTFRAYFLWAYNHRLFCQPLVEPPDKAEVKRMDLLIRCYILGDKLMDDDFQDAIVDVLVQFCEQANTWPITMTRFIFENTPVTSPLRAFIVDVIVHLNFLKYWNTMTSTDCLETHNEDALFHITRTFMRLRDVPVSKQTAPFRGSDRCVYHNHKKHDKPCYKETYGI
ncbi:hypothetical protein EG328_010864 [Venturia inaequalis]|uniref:BTB domain-containing protein n=1 Tax=Venturia inaequalis TaxID=5025 RepID=A0A8H3V8S0_VENIN|nr:hypothetical protein EG328_010864 [Venturia inaequalis]